MPGLGRFPCPSCHYVAGNRRMLARHAVLIHSEKVFKCPLCPFITRYAANWYRHKRDLHGLTKVTNCEICGFFANSTIELAQHKESEHQEELQLDKYEDKYNKEKLRLSGNADPNSRPPAAVEEFVTHLQPDVILDIYNIKSEGEDNEYGGKVNDCVTFSLPSNGSLDTSDENFIPNGHSEELPEYSNVNNVDASGNPLRPLKVKRSYNCDLCGLLTGNPREFLFHQRDIHSEKINIFECKYCIYASKHIQKLHRHCNLVHKQLLEKDPDYRKQLEANKKVKQSDMFNLSLVPQNNFAYANYQQNQQQVVVKKPPKRNQVFFNCSQCEYKTRNKSFLLHHEKTAHVKKRLYRCLQCGYVTNEKGRYTKHIKYHTLPKMQCQYCFFKTAYKWNMDRHMKNHEAGAEGAFRCNQCNFTTSTRQSFKSHITHHHNANSLDVEEEEFEDGNEPDAEVEWQDIDVMPLQEDDSNLPLDENVESYNNSDQTGVSNVMYDDGQSYDKSLICKTCNFKANWPFELKKHEEMHRSQKKHPCPLCGMRFEHIAWLTKHLRRVHQENSQAGNIAAAFELMKPNRRKPAQKEYNPDAVLPMYQQVLNKNSANKHQLQTNQNSMLSTLLNKPLNPNPAVPLSADKYMYKSKAFASSTNMSRHLRTSTYNEPPQGNDSSNMPVSKPKSVPTCNVCGYKTRWLSELQRHMRVHSQEKPFHCPKCKYHCKWKGDLNRHLMKYHGIKVPSNNNKKTPVSKLKFTRSNNLNNSSDNWPVSDMDGNHVSSPPTRRQEDEHPLDLTLKETFANSNSDIYDPYEFESFPSNDSSLEEQLNDMEIEPPTTGTGYDLVPYKSPLQQLSEQPVPGEENSPIPSTKRKYQCPFCTFSTTTASRFHVHIVQHYNRRPFMCSVCNHSSNWEWDITKHIRLKNCRDKYNNKACVLLTDETGRRNYDKYDKYLVDINHQPTSPRIPVPKASETFSLPEPDVRRNNNSKSSYVEPPQQPKNCTYDFRNIGSNFEDRNIGSNFEDAPENIVVTPDINLSDPLEAMAPTDNNQFSYNSQYTMSDNYGPKSNDSKLFACKHCDFKHATKRVVISHLSLHTGIKPYRCRACGICSNWRHVIVRHVKDAHNGYMNEVEDRISYIQEGYILRIAPPGTPTREINSFPPETNLNSLSFECKVCPYKCDKEFYMKFHMKQHRPREGAIFKCDYCPYYVKFKKTLVRHLKLHDPAVDVNLVNENPDISSTSNVSIESKALEVENDLCTLYSPQDSPEDSINISFDTLNQYSSSETSSPQRAKRHICEGCPYKTDNKTQYLYHKQFHRPNPSAPFKCAVCSYWATMQHLLTQHMKVHEQESEQSNPRRRQSRTTPERTRFDDDEGCDKMSILYVKRGELVIKMFKCGYCPMMNKKKANVRVHQKMHGVIVNNGKFACSYCDYQCLNQGGLTNHLKIHQKTQEKLTIIEEHDIEQENTRKKLDTSGEETPVRTKRVNLTCSRCPAVFKTSAHLENHLKFHGSFLPYPCSYCDYRARHKPHLIKHELVHSPEYAEKQNASQKSGSSEADNILSSVNGDISAANISIVKKIDQMLLLEEKELNAALKKTGNVTSCLHRCILCPAIFIKQATLVYHASLHGSDGEFKCPHCDYAVNRYPNLTAHVQVHPKKGISRTPTKKPPPSKKVPLKIFPCPKCPAVFYKQDRFDRHFNLHGKNWKFVCDYCDYSVRFAANLIKHKKIHLSKTDSENTAPAALIENSVPVATAPAAAAPLSENAYYDLEEKLMYICDRCPYAMNRKDAVQSHMRRHWLRDGFKCPYCDYSSMQSGFLQTHIKTHIQPNQLFPAQCFMKFESFKICCKDEKGEEVVLFDDETMSNYVEEEEEEEHYSESETTENSQASKIRRLSCDSSSTTTDSNFSDTRTKVPVVVLSDIFTSKNKAVRKWVPKLKIPKIKITKSSSNEKLYTKINISEYDDESKSNSSISKSKPSLVVKISKVEGLNNREKATYSICTKTSDDSFSSVSTPSPASCSSSSNKVCDSEVSKQVENTTPEPDTNKTSEDGSTIEMDSNSSSTCEIDINMDTVSGVEPSVPSDQCSSELEIKNTVESNESCFAGVKVPLNEISNDKPSTFKDLTFDDKLPPALTMTHLSNGLSLMPEEIKVDL